MSCAQAALFTLLLDCCLVPIQWFVMFNCTCGSGSALEGADSSITLTATGSNYSAGKFPHLAGCKILTLPEMSLDLVWLCACLLPIKAITYWTAWVQQVLRKHHGCISQQKIAHNWNE